MNDGGEGTPYDIRAEIGSISAEVAPIAGEKVVVKQVPNAFHGTDLEETLKGLMRRRSAATSSSPGS